MPSEKRVREVGRWRIAYRWGRYRTGFHTKRMGGFTGALPFVWFNAIKRDRK